MQGEERRGERREREGHMLCVIGRVLDKYLKTIKYIITNLISVFFSFTVHFLLSTLGVYCCFALRRESQYE